MHTTGGSNDTGGPDYSQEHNENEEVQEIIDKALIEMNNGNYEQAISLLDKAKQLYPNSRAEELQDLIIKLKANSSKNKYNDYKTSDSTPSSVRHCKHSSPDVRCSPDEYMSHTDYTMEQLNLVKKIKSCKSYYQVLSISHNASENEIKKSYKKLALNLHPDKNHAPGAVEAFKTLGNAMAVLTDSIKRKEYDLGGGNFITPNGNSHNQKSPSSYQQYYSHNHNQHHRYNSSDASFSGGEEFTAEELFHMFFGNYPSTQSNYRHRPYHSANQRQPQEHGQQPSLAFGLLLVMILLSMFMSLFSTDPVYSLSQSSKYNVRRQTQHLSVPYYVKANFDSEYKGSLARLENSVEEDYVYNMKQHCFRERNYREAMMARARSFGSRAQFAQAQAEMDELIEKLRATNVSLTNTSDTTATLLSEISATKDPKLFDKHDLADFFLNLTQSSNVNVRKEATKCIAEITKSELQRKKFTKIEIIKMFIDCLRNVNNDTESLELPIQVCRALGNICYLNDEARDIILDLKGDTILIKLLDLIDVKDKTNILQFVKVRGGLLSNYLLGGESLAKRAMELEIMQKIQNIIAIGVKNVEENEDLLLNTLPLMSILTENVPDLNFDASLNIQLSRILAASTNPDLAEMCLELLHYQAENDDVKLLLAKDGLCETIYQLLEKYKTLARTSEARALMKLACELIVLILTGDESMHYLYSTSLLKNMEDWLDSEDVDLLTTGVLALGNFARTDSHCIYMVENKTMNKLLEVLSKNNGVKDDVRLQHALLSTLRNLVIPKPNKGAVIQAGLVETILPMLEIHQPPVVFKLLGTLRMTVDGQEKLALELLKNKTLIEQLVHWSKSSDYAGVTGESLRLMAWLIKHAYLSKIAYALPRKGDAPAEQLADKLPTMEYDRTSLNEFINNDNTIEAMVNMLTSQHLVMQNEALIALCILCVVYLSSSSSPPADESGKQLQDAFIKYEVGKKLAELINKSSDTMTKEIVENLENFTNLLRTSEKLVAHLEQHNISELLKSIPILTEYCTI